jgi:hypothetical protein
LAAKRINFCSLFFVGGIQDGVGNDEALDRAAAYDVRFDNFVDVFRFDASVPDCLGVNHDRRAQLALIQATGFVGADIFQSALRQFGLEEALQFALACWIATAARVAFFPLIHANKNVLVEFGHDLV